MLLLGPHSGWVGGTQDCCWDHIVGDAGDVEAVLPHFWQHALEVFEQSDFIRDYLGAELQKTFSLCKRKEKHEFDSRVTLLEYDAYL